MRLLRAPILCPSGGGFNREAGGTLVESLVGGSSTRKRTVARSIGRVSNRFGEGGGRLDRRRARGVLNLVRRNQGREPGGFRGKSLSLTTVCFLLTKANKERRTCKVIGAFFRDARGFERLDADARAGFTNSKPSPLWTLVLQFYLFLPV